MWPSTSRVDEILRGHDEVAERGGEVVPVARLVQTRGTTTIVVSSRSSAVQRNASGSSGGGRGSRARRRVVGVDGVRDQRAVARDAHVELRRARAPLTAIVSGTIAQRLLRAAELGERARRVEPLAIQILHVGGDVGFAPGDEPVAAEATAGAPGSVAPMTSKSPAEMCARYQSRESACRGADRWRAAACRSRSACRPRPSCSSRALRPCAAEQQVAHAGVAVATSERSAREPSGGSRRVRSAGRPAPACLPSSLHGQGMSRALEDAQAVGRVRRHQLAPSAPRRRLRAGRGAAARTSSSRSGPTPSSSPRRATSAPVQGSGSKRSSVNSGGSCAP